MGRDTLLGAGPSASGTFDGLTSSQFRLVNPEEDWKLTKGAFAAPTNLNVRLEARS